MRWLTLLFCMMALPLAAQDDDRGYLTGLLEDALGGEGRIVRVQGFEGALSSRATVRQITVADSEGVWLTMEDLVLAWDRRALISRRLDVTELSASVITLTRPPIAEDGLPSAEAQGFRLPTLPVGVQIDNFRVDRFELGEAVLGEAVIARMSGRGRLTDGNLDLAFSARRTDAKLGRFDVRADFTGAGTELTLSVLAEEGPGGLAVDLIGIPGSPALRLALEGSGTPTDFATRLSLTSDGAERLAGTVNIAQSGDTTAFSADIGGDMSTLFVPQYREFLGSDLQILASGFRNGDGALDIPTLSLQAQSISLEGAVALNADLFPTQAQVVAKIQAPDGAPVLLPGSGSKVGAANLSLQYSGQDQGLWQISGQLIDYNQADLSFGEARLSGGGQLRPSTTGIGALDGDLSVTLGSLRTADAGVAQLLGETLNAGFLFAYTEGAPLNLSEISLRAGEVQITGQAVIEGLAEAFQTRLSLALDLPDLARLSGMIGFDVTGSGALQLDGALGLGGTADVTLRGQTTNLAIGQETIDGLLTGLTTLDLRLRRDEAGTRIAPFTLSNPELALTGDAALTSGASNVQVKAALRDASKLSPQLSGPLSLEADAIRPDGGEWQVLVGALGPFGASASITGQVTGPEAALGLVVNLPDVAPLVPKLTGALVVTGDLARDKEDWRADVIASGPLDATATIQGIVTGQTPELAVTLRVPNLQSLVPQIQGPVAAQGTVKLEGLIARIAANLQGPGAARAEVVGTFSANETRMTYAVTAPSVATFVPGLSGGADLQGTLVSQGSTLSITAAGRGPFGVSGSAEYQNSDGIGRARANLTLPNIATLVPDLAGAVQLSGEARQQAQGWAVEVSTIGPATAGGQASGLVRSDGTLDLSLTGTAPIGLVNGLISPRRAVGLARYDLRLSGPAELQSLSGQVTLSDGRVSFPAERVALEGLRGTISLGGGTAQVELRTGASGGGAITLSGPIALAPGFDASLRANVSDLRLSDPSLYRTRVDGTIVLTGPVLGGAIIAGALQLSDTEITVPSGAATGFTIVPRITHLGASPAVRQTQRRAGLLKSSTTQSGGTSPRPYGLDILVEAASGIFVRGRGLDAELGGGLRITGTTTNPISAGRFELVRGRLDILTKRFTLTEGLITLAGALDPFLRFVAETPTDNGVARIILEGTVSDLAVSFEAEPAVPEDEVLALLIFGQDTSSLSPFQLLELANAASQLSGGGGDTLVTRIRRGLDLDDLDITTSESGQTQLRLGKYISENAYTDIQVGDESAVRLNIDLTPNLTVRGTVKDTGESSIGIFFEKDY